MKFIMKYIISETKYHILLYIFDLLNWELYILLELL